MSNIRPAGMSDEDTDSDDDYYDRPKKYYYRPSESKNTEITLQDAILNGNVESVEDIVINNLNNNVNVRLDSGWTPLMHACFHAQDKIVEFLLDRGADPNLHADSVTPIMAACSNSSAENDTVFNILTILIAKDSLLNVGDKYGQTPLMRAIGSGRVAVVQKLLDMEVNIEMRDQQGWTALFWAVHHNQPEILEMLIARGARISEVDKQGRKPIDIAQSHDYQNIVEILQKHMDVDESEDLSSVMPTELTSWQDFYPGVIKVGKPSYANEIPHLLYGMNCDKLGSIIHNSGMDLRTFLLLEDKDMIELGIELPYQRQRLKQGLKNFHRHTWKLNAVAGMFARKNDNYTVLDCLTSLGSHLQQVYILEATLTYSLREYTRIQSQLKYEPPDSPVINKLKTAADKLIKHINNIRHEIKNMRKVLTKISKNNPQPADIIKERTFQEVAVDYMTEALIFCSLGVLVYHARNYFTNMLNK